MSQQKRDLSGLLEEAGQNLQSNLHTCVLCKITKVNPKTVNCQPIVNRIVDGVSVELPEFVDVPAVTMQGGSSYIAMPLTVGDYCILMCMERCFDQWYNSVRVDKSLPLDFRMHDYSDGFALVGVNPLKDAITIPTVTTQQGDEIHNGNKTVNGNFTINGDLQVNGNITCTGRGRFDTIEANNFAGHGGGDMTSTSVIRTTQDMIAGLASLITALTHVHQQVPGATNPTLGPQAP